MNGLKIICMRVEHLVFLDSVSFLPFALRKLPEAFGITVAKSWYPHYLNTKANLDYVGKIPVITYYGVDEMSGTERNEFLAWYEGQKDVAFDNKCVQEAHCQDDVSALREACCVLKREFVQIGNNDVFLESVTIASACNKVLRKRFLIPNTIGLIPFNGYTTIVNYSNKSIMWLVSREQTDGCTIRHARNGREYRLPELTSRRVDGFCAETRTVYEIFGCLYHGHTCLPYLYVTTFGGHTLAQRYEQTITADNRCWVHCRGSMGMSF